MQSAAVPRPADRRRLRDRIGVGRYTFAAYSLEDEGNAYARLGEVLGRLAREDEARAAYEAGIRQAEKFGHSGMAEDLRVALIQLRE
jgi:hypothetical protein